MDGMAAAERLRAHDTDAFNTLCQTPILYRFQDATADLAAERTMIEVDTYGQFRAICYDEHSIAPLPIKGPRLKKFYPAYRQLAELLQDPGAFVVYRLAPGDLVLFDNTRILHGHTAFSTEGAIFRAATWMPTGVYSSLAVLSRTRSADDPHHD